MSIETTKNSKEIIEKETGMFLYSLFSTRNITDKGVNQINIEFEKFWKKVCEIAKENVSPQARTDRDRDMYEVNDIPIRK